MLSTTKYRAASLHFCVLSVSQWENGVSSHTRRPTEESQHVREEAE